VANPNPTEVLQAAAAPENFGARMAAKKKAAIAKAPMSQGVGESKRFGGDYNPPLAEGEVDWDKLTLNGQPIPPEIRTKLLYHYTDQAIAQRMENQPAVQFTRHEEDKQIFDKFEDGLKANVEPWEGGVDPLIETKKAHEQPGTRYRYLSQAKVDRDGWRGWEPVKVMVKGVETIVKLGNMMLGKMSEDRAIKRDKFFQSRAKEQMVDAQDRVAELRDQVISEKNMRDIKRRRRVDEHEGFQTVHGDSRETDDPDFMREEVPRVGGFENS
jgi:hypothetical protein